MSKAFENMESNDFALSIKWLLGWFKRTKMGLSIDLYEFHLSSHVSKYKLLFKYCNLLEDIFVLNNNNITWNKNISNEEIKEIQNYIDDNYKISIRIRHREM